jgi:hypothetical protein
MTLVEVLLAAAISSGVIGGLMYVLVMVAREQKWEVADIVLQQEAGQVQDQLMRMVRSMSQSESVIFADPIIKSGVTVHQSVVLARGKAPEYKREKIAFNSSNHTLDYVPDISVTGNTQVLYTNHCGAVLRNLCFYPSLKPGLIPDSSTLNIWLEMDDAGLGQRRKSDGTMVTSTVIRSFTVKMRNQ